ncbi:disks large homolog 1-like isoform X3 [Xyrichtys novacula]|uniref:Disks large homolog 1-like isoform X3 n=1 Tax=Xyrichtys novacula TaxID=13765 RepID=A0AAV1FCW5_XYRNO|nr:disks large homolog 1-like isoform X3 [Xyrichtys novacula]
MVHKYDTARAVDLLRRYQADLTSPEEQALKTSVGKVSSILGSQLFHALLDIQECYEVTLQLNKEQTVVKEDSRQDAWEDQGEEEKMEGVSLVRVTSRRSPHKVERVSGLVAHSHIDIPNASCAPQHLVLNAFPVTTWLAAHGSTVATGVGFSAELRTSAVVRRKKLEVLRLVCVVKQLFSAAEAYQ